MNNLQYPIWNLENSVQISDGLTETSADGAFLAFDKKYGIMFCSYMPGKQGCYGESRSKVALSYFPATQPTNIRFVTIAEGNDEYCEFCVSLGDGKVRVIYEKNSRAEGDHIAYYKDFNAITNELSEEKVIMLKKTDGTLTPLCCSEVFSYLKNLGYTNQKFKHTEQWAICCQYVDEDGKGYGAYTTEYSEPVLYSSNDNFATVEFFATYPKPVQYEFGYRFLNDKLYAIYRTDVSKDSIYCVTSSDKGKTWSEPVLIEDSVSCRPGIICYKGKILIAYNHFNDDTGSRPNIQQGRTSVRFKYGDAENPANNPIVAEIYRKYGTVNLSMIDLFNDVYFAFSTSEAALEYQNGNPAVRGKDAIRYIKLGDVDTWSK